MPGKVNRDMKQKNKTLMTRIRAFYKRILSNRVGQSTTEYILILAIVVMIAGKLKSTLITKIGNGVESLNFEKAMHDPN